MIIKRKTGLILIVIFTMMVNFTVKGAEFNQTRHIEETDADVFVTETGTSIDSDLVTILDPNMDIRAYLFFEDMKINGWEVLHNATLRLRTASTLSFDADSAVTIYGVNDYVHFGSGTQGFGPLRSPSAITSAPLTSNFVNVNTSQFYGSQWWEIDVTTIVNELKSNRHYDGPGMDRSQAGDNMGFIILGAGGSDTRYFYDYKAANNYEAQIVLHWTTSPPPPPGGGDFNSTYRGYNIFYRNETGWLNYTSYNEVDGPNRLTVENSTYVFSTGEIDANDAVRLWKTTSAVIFDVKFGLNVTDFTDASPAAVRFWLMFFWGREVNDYALDFTPDLWGFTLRSNAGGNVVEPMFYAFDGGGYEDPLGIDYAIPWMRWNHITFNMITKEYSWKMYTDFAMTNLDAEINGTHSLNNLNTVNYIYALSTPDNTYAPADRGQFILLSAENVQDWVITDENGTIIEEGLEDYEDALIFIDDILGVDPDEPAPAGQGWPASGVLTRFRTRFYILIIGIGLLFGPLFMFAFSRPSGYEFTIGMFVMLIGFALMYAAGQV